MMEASHNLTTSAAGEPGNQATNTKKCRSGLPLFMAFVKNFVAKKI